VQKLEAADDKIRLAADGNRGSPVLPAIGMLADIEGGAEQPNDNDREMNTIHNYKSLSH
jgi:hypothetical protein